MKSPRSGMLNPSLYSHVIQSMRLPKDLEIWLWALAALIAASMVANFWNLGETQGLDNVVLHATSRHYAARSRCAGSNWHIAGLDWYSHGKVGPAGLGSWRARTEYSWTELVSLIHCGAINLSNIVLDQ